MGYLTALHSECALVWKNNFVEFVHERSPCWGSACIQQNYLGKFLCICVCQVTSSFIYFLERCQIVFISAFIFFISPGLFHPCITFLLFLSCAGPFNLLSAYHPSPMSKENRKLSYTDQLRSSKKTRNPPANPLAS